VRNSVRKQGGLQDKSIGFMNLDKNNKTWEFTIDQFNSKTISVKQINDSLLLNCNDSTTMTILKSWNKLSVDTISIIHSDNIYNLTVGMNNIYNEDRSGIFATIYFKVILLYDTTTKRNKLTEIKYLATTKNDN
jgi:hypothetical protein